jgi:hypothetical protein
MAARRRIILVVVHRPRHDGGLILECASRQRVSFQYSENSTMGSIVRGSTGGTFAATGCESATMIVSTRWEREQF